MKRVGVVLPYFLARAAVNPGDVVTNPKYPNQGKFKSTCLDISLEKNNLLITNVEDFSDVQKRDRGAGLSLILSQIFKSKLDSMSKTDLSLQTKKVVTYQLDNSDQSFTSLCQDLDFQKWFETAVKLHNVYFVVGLQTISDADVDLANENLVEGQTGTTIVTGQPGADVEVAVQGHHARSRGTKFKAANEQIYAVEYRKVVSESIMRKDIGSASLSSKQFWKPYLTTRGDASEKVLQVKLVDTDSLQDEGVFDVLSSDDSLVMLYDAES